MKLMPEARQMDVERRRHAVRQKPLKRRRYRRLQTKQQHNSSNFKSPIKAPPPLSLTGQTRHRQGGGPVNDKAWFLMQNVSTMKKVGGGQVHVIDRGCQ